jgi:hypothetical protein
MPPVLGPIRRPAPEFRSWARPAVEGTQSCRVPFRVTRIVFGLRILRVGTTSPSSASRSTAASLSTCVRRLPPDHSQCRLSAGPDRPRYRSRAYSLWRLASFSAVRQAS